MLHRPRAKARASALILAVAALVLTLMPALPASADPPTVTLKSSSSTVASGQQLTYTITVLHHSTMKDVTITDQLNGMTGVGGAAGFILSSSSGTCTQSADLVRCETPVLQGNQLWTVTIRGVVNAANGTTLHNTAVVSGKKPQYTTAATTSTLVTNEYQGPQPDLTLSINAPTSLDPGEAGTYFLTVNNLGNGDAQDVRVVNTLPDGFSVADIEETNLFACTAVALPTVTCDGGRVNAGKNATIAIHVTAAGDPGTYEDTAVVDPFDFIDEANELNNTASTEMTVPRSAPPQDTLTMTKSDDPDPVRPGDLLTYTIVVTNTHPTKTAEKIRVVDGTQGLEAASVVATHSHPRGICHVSASEVVCEGISGSEPKLKPGESFTITITGSVVASAGSVIHNTANVTGKTDKVLNHNTASASSTVRPGKELTVAQQTICAPCPFWARETFDIEIGVGNSGLDDATNVLVREPLPAGVVFNGFDATGGFMCSEAGGVVSCEGGTVPGDPTGTDGGGAESIVLHLIGPPEPATLDAVVTVDPNNAWFEADETNNTDPITIPFQTGIDLTVMQSPNFPEVATDGTLTYTITPSNIGTADARNVVVKDILPAGTRFRDAFGDSDHDFTCEHQGPTPGGTVVCTGGELDGTYSTGVGGPPHVYGPPDEATITVTLFAPSQPGEIGNQVRIDPDGTHDELSESNNVNRTVSEVVVAGPGEFVDLSVTLSHTPEPVMPSSTLAFTLTVANSGTAPAFNIEARDFLPSGTTFRSADGAPLSGGNGGFFCTHVNQIVDCSGGSLAAGGSTTITITVTSSMMPGAYTNQARVDPDNEIPEGDETNNSASESGSVLI